MATKSGRLYQLIQDDFTVQVTIEPKWLGLDFNLADSDLHYPINTDLYDITREEHQKFAQEIGADIIDFLNNLENGKIRIGYDKGRPFLLIPTPDGLALLKRGMFLVSKKFVRSAKPFEEKYDLRSLKIGRKLQGE